MKTEITTNGSAMLVKLEGRMDSTTAPELERTVNPRLEGIDALTLDFAQLRYVSSAGLRVILALYKKMRAVDGRLTILNPNEMVMDVFETTGLSDMLDIGRSAEEESV